MSPCLIYHLRALVREGPIKKEPPQPLLSLASAVFTRGIKVCCNLSSLSGGVGLSRLAMIWHFRVQKQETLKALTSMLHSKIGFLWCGAYCRQRRSKDRKCGSSVEQWKRSCVSGCYWLSCCSVQIPHIKWICSLQALIAPLLIICVSKRVNVCPCVKVISVFSSLRGLSSSCVSTMTDGAQVVFPVCYWSRHINMKCW